MPTKLIPLLLGCLLTVSVQAAYDENAELKHDMTALPESMPAQDFLLKDADGKIHSLKNYRGKVVLVNFWATWCPPCRKEMPSMERLHQKMKSQDFVVLALDQKENEDQIFAFTGEIGVDLSFPILFDTDGGVSVDYGIIGLPTTYLIDKQGNARFRAIGGRDFYHPDVEKLIRQLIQE